MIPFQLLSLGYYLTHHTIPFYSRSSFLPSTATTRNTPPGSFVYSISPGLSTLIYPPYLPSLIFLDLPLLVCKDRPDLSFPVQFPLSSLGVHGLTTPSGDNDWHDMGWKIYIHSGRFMAIPVVFLLSLPALSRPVLL